MSGQENPTPEQIQEKEDQDKTQKSLDRARKILATYYVVLPFVLIYLLFKVFPVIDDWICHPIFFFYKTWVICVTLEERLMLLVVVSGALGSYIHSATSYSDYRGNRQFGPSWLLWYLLRPLVGICLALVVYFGIRGGLLTTVLSGSATPNAKEINPFGIAAIAGLTGMFSKQAADKLAEVFTTLFKSSGDLTRRDSLTPAPAPEIKKIDPTQGSAAGATKVTITGAGLVVGATVTFGGNNATNITVVNETTITAETPAGQGVVDVIVANPDGQKVTASEAYTYLPETTDDAGGAEDAGGDAEAGDAAGDAGGDAAGAGAGDAAGAGNGGDGEGGK